MLCLNRYYADHFSHEANVAGRPVIITADGTIKFNYYQKRLDMGPGAIGDLVHINVNQFGERALEISKNANNLDYMDIDCKYAFAQLRQFEIVDMKTCLSNLPEEKWERYVGEIYLKEIDRKNSQYDGRYWIYYEEYLGAHSWDTQAYLAYIGHEITDDNVCFAKQHGMPDYGNKLGGLFMDVAMIKTEVLAERWDSWVQHSYFNKTYGKAVSRTTLRFPDMDYPEEENEVHASGILAVIIWGFIPEGMLGFSYLVMALFFSALVFVINNGFFIIICIFITYLSANLKLKTNRRL